MHIVLDQLRAEVKFANNYLMQILSLWVICLVWLLQSPIKVSVVNKFFWSTPVNLKAEMCSMLRLLYAGVNSSNKS